MSLIVEGGKETINHFLKLNYWNEARVIVGNKEFKNGLKSPEIDKKYSVVQNIGKDIIYTYYNVWITYYNLHIFFNGFTF